MSGNIVTNIFICLFLQTVLGNRICDANIQLIGEKYNKYILN